MTTIRTLRLDGELTIYCAQETHRQLLQTLADQASEGGPQALEIDLSGVSEIDTAGVQLLLTMLRYAGAHGVDTRLVRESAAVAETMALLSLDGYLEQRAHA